MERVDRPLAARREAAGGIAEPAPCVCLHGVAGTDYVSSYAAYLWRSLSRNFLLSAVTSQALGQKHRSTHHQSLGTPAFISSGSSLSKFSLPVPNGLCVDGLCSLSEPSESIRCTGVILPLSFWSYPNS